MKGGKAQVSQEFFLFVGIAFMIAIIILGIIAGDINENVEERRKRAVDDIGFYVQGELVTAAGVKDGYNRTFNIPDKSDTISYIISITNYTKLIVTSQDYEALFYIPNVNGTILIGNNTIRKTNGTVFLNE